jgi:DNA-binding MarR family transcriptional regulator
MSKVLHAPDATVRVIAPTTTKKMAQRMLIGSQEVAAALPKGFHTPVALDVLLTLYIAEDDARYLAVGDLEVGAGVSPGTVERWVLALISEGLIERRDNLIALSQAGHNLVTATIEDLYRKQRALD